MPLGVQRVQSLGAIPSSLLEQISVPSALFCLWRSQPGAFVLSGKAVLCMSPIGHQHLKAAGEDAHSAPESSHSSSPRSFSLFLVCSLSLKMRHFPRSQLTFRIRSRLFCAFCRMGWEGTFPALITLKRTHEQCQALEREQQGQEGMWGRHGAF